MSPVDENDIKTLAQAGKDKPRPNRKTRRQKPLGARIIKLDYIKSLQNKFTKATHSIKKERAKNAKTDQQRKREIARARKARKESYSKVS